MPLPPWLMLVVMLWHPSPMRCMQDQQQVPWQRRRWVHQRTPSSPRLQGDQKIRSVWADGTPIDVRWNLMMICLMFDKWFVWFVLCMYLVITAVDFLQFVMETSVKTHSRLIFGRLCPLVPLTTSRWDPSGSTAYRLHDDPLVQVGLFFSTCRSICSFSYRFLAR